MQKISIYIFLFLSTHLAKAQTQKNILQDTSLLTNFLAKQNVWGDEIVLGYTKNNNPIKAYYYNKGGKENAMILAGVHGSEFYGVDVAKNVKQELDKLNPVSFYWKVLVIPELFADNIEIGKSNPFSLNNGRTSKGKEEDPNRQMPKPAELYVIGKNISSGGNNIEVENQILLTITQLFNPLRIASLHCKNDILKEQIGIYADPRTNTKNEAKSFSADAKLAIAMAYTVQENGGAVPGNFIAQVHPLGRNDTIINVHYCNAAYPLDPQVVFKNKIQLISCDKKYNNRKVTYGTWASTEIVKANKVIKEAATILTIELPQYHSFFKTGYCKQLGISQQQNTLAYTKAIIDIFLENLN